MSNIPEARRLLTEMLSWEQEDHNRDQLWAALDLMTRKKPAFRAPPSTKPLTPFNVEYARSLRETGMGVRQIAKTLNSCVATVSRACR